MRGDQVTGDDKEDVDADKTAAERTGSQVMKDDQKYRNGAQPLKFWAEPHGRSIGLHRGSC